MNDDRLDALLGSFYRDTARAPKDRDQGVGEVMDRVRRTRQRGRWLPFPLLRRKAPTPTATDTADYRLRTIPATNGHAPTVIGRTQTMFSPVKAITAGALVFAIGGVFFIAQPFDQGGSIPGAEQDTEPMAPVEVTGTLTWSEDKCTETPERVGPVEWNIGATCELDIEWSDPRLQGASAQLHNGMSYSFGDDIELDIDNNVLDIVADTGAWRMRPYVRFHFPDMSEPPGSPEWYVLDGEGDYEGLSVVLAKEGNDLDGFIVSTDMVPPAPEGASTR